MIVTFVLGVLAGWFAKLAEPQVRGVAESATRGAGPLEPMELRLFAFAAMMLGAALVAWLLVDEPNPVWLALGACLGVLGPRLKRRWDARKVPDYDN